MCCLNKGDKIVEAFVNYAVRLTATRMLIRHTF